MLRGRLSQNPFSRKADAKNVGESAPNGIVFNVEPGRIRIATGKRTLPAGIYRGPATLRDRYERA